MRSRAKPIAGKVSRISPAVNTQTRAFPFEALVPNREGLLKPGTFARVHLTTSLVEPVLTIPYDAMQYRYGVYRVFVVNGDRLAMHELKTGDRIGDRMEILDGSRSAISCAHRRRQPGGRHEGHRRRRVTPNRPSPAKKTE